MVGKVALVSIWVGLVACSFDSNADSVGGASLGDGESSSTGGGSNTTPTSVSSASASGGSSATSSDPTQGSTGVEPTSSTTQTSNTSPTSDTNADDTTSESESATSNGTTDDTNPSTSSPTTTGPAVDPYAACPGGTDEECPVVGEVCRTFEDAWNNIDGSFCAETGCSGDDDCPDGVESSAVPRCRGQATTFCVLDCEADTEGCPAGMECEHVWITSTMVYEDRCYWPA